MPIPNQYLMLGLLAKRLDEIEGLRKAENMRVLQLDAVNPALAVIRDNNVGSFENILDTLEKIAIKDLEVEMKNHPLWSWCKETKGVGAKTFARFLAEVGGDVYIDSRTGMPRSKSSLIRFLDLCPDYDTGTCHRKKKGETLSWNIGGKTRLYIIAEQMVKNPHADPSLKELYYSEKEKQRPRVETDMHAHRRAMRAVMKRVAIMAYNASRDAQINHEAALVA